jgi:hypothetical protein
MVHPVIGGSGRRLFAVGEPLLRLQLVNAKTTCTGVAVLTDQLRAA